jgi:hypothetical protein
MATHTTGKSKSHELENPYEAQYNVWAPKEEVSDVGTLSQYSAITAVAPKLTHCRINPRVHPIIKK